MTPQETFEYKKKWQREGCYSVQVDIDSDVWGKDWCRKRLNRIDWSFDKFTRPDDSHTFSFHYAGDAMAFLTDYENHNPRFPTEVS